MNSLLSHKKLPLTCPRDQRKKLTPIDGLVYLVFGLGILLFSLPFFLLLTGVRWNTSSSLPLGFYWHTQESLRPGTLVHFCLVRGVAEYGYQRGYIGAGTCSGLYEQVLKPIAATAGDTVEIGILGVSINGKMVQNSPVFDTDSQGRPNLFLLAPGKQIVPEGYVFVLSTWNPRSWDSRYFGFIPVWAIRGTARPLWVWK